MIEQPVVETPEKGLYLSIRDDTSLVSEQIPMELKKYSIRDFDLNTLTAMIEEDGGEPLVDTNPPLELY